ncbi:unnamed protein product [Arabidopsis lyrata]|nr:unnamed protein product [Arabidopsis lyrata]
MKLKSLFFPTFLIFLISLDSVSEQEICFNGFFKPNSTYDLNRRQILSTLASNVTAHNGFFNSKIAQDPNRVFIIGMCIPGTKPETCSDCIKGASEKISKSFPNQTDAYTWPDCCMVRYSNVSFSGSLVMEPSETLYHTGDIEDTGTNLTVFDRIWDELMLRTITAASLSSTHGSSFGQKYFGAEVASLTAFETMYAMMQCTPDVSSKDCEFCLKTSVGDYESCCRGKQGGAVIRPSCFVRWDLYPYAGAFENIALPPPPRSLYLSHRFLCLLRLAIGQIQPSKMENHFRQGLWWQLLSYRRYLGFSCCSTRAATDKFSDSNMIGRGGFGEVYRGTFSTGTEVAVKRLSKTSGQGAEEFKNEAVLEFVPNKSLDYFLFDPAKQGELDWTRRYNIIGGIARGILYLHHDSRLTFIHRDLKASNILLDANMNPKIADFGMARIFGVDQSQANTRRIVGTFGYMSPEYAMHGHFSMKSDVYSFGILVLEVISGKKTSSFYNIDDSGGNLVTHAWRLWRNGSPLELVDLIIGESYQSNEATRCIHIALLCVQEDPADRPLLPAIILMLTSSTTTLPVPRAPGFCLGGRELDLDSLEYTQSTSWSIPCSINDASITEFDPR